MYIYMYMYMSRVYIYIYTCIYMCAHQELLGKPRTAPGRLESEEGAEWPQIWAACQRPEPALRAPENPHLLIGVATDIHM